MNIVPPSSSRAAGEVHVTTKPKALLATVLSGFWALVCIGAWSLGWSFAAAIALLSAQTLLLAVTACLWRFERRREIKFKGDLPEPPVIHGV